MYGFNTLTKVFESSEEIIFDDLTNIVLMSDCHRGDGTWNDNFAKNQRSYFTALEHYYKNDYIYIEIGDGDELWEVKEFQDILNMHKDVFWLLSKFHKEGRFYCIYGNHDMIKKDKKFVEENLYSYYDGRTKKTISLFNNIKIHEGIILKQRGTGNKIFLIHGHQVDFLNYTLWRLAKFLVRNLWRPLESHGIRDKASPAKNYKKKDIIDNKITKWANIKKHMIITGHTHRPMFPDVGEVPYFNDGSCVHPRFITAIEIERGYITLVKWGIETKKDGTLFIGRDIIAGPRLIKEYFEFYNQKQRDDPPWVPIIKFEI